MATRRKFLIRSGQGLASLALLPGGTLFPGRCSRALTSKTLASAAVEPGRQDRTNGPGRLPGDEARSRQPHPGRHPRAAHRGSHPLRLRRPVPIAGPKHRISLPSEEPDGGLERGFPFSPSDRGRPGRRKSLTAQGEIRVPGNGIPAVPRNIGTIRKPPERPRTKRRKRWPNAVSISISPRSWTSTSIRRIL